MASRTLRFPGISRVEGEGAVTLRYQNGNFRDVELRIFEPPRFFEGFLVGRHYLEVPDITARICGICPIAYQITSALAVEDALQVHVGGPLRDLRRLIYCGEWIKSHALHIHLLHAPDFLGYPDAIAMAKDHPEEVKRGLQIKAAGNRLMECVGGRDVHPVNLCVGGFYSVPQKRELRALQPMIESALHEAIAVVQWVARFPFVDFESGTESVAMSHLIEYPIFEGRISSSHGFSIGVSEFSDRFTEHQERYSHALFCLRDGKEAYQVGPIARYNQSRSLLSPRALQAAMHAHLGNRVGNPYKSIVVRAVEVVFALEEALRLIDAYEEPDHPSVATEVREGVGFACSEAPRGICHHTYRIDEQGLVTWARIVPPTSQNQASIERDLSELVVQEAPTTDEAVRTLCEGAVRNYDPCISCATHHLRVERVQQ